ncbi:DUF6318 family protein [Arthrobacter sp. zg-Y877]|uniref:DUF6318 family protein n=1 Tax=Arthrobacter sp. zg-Y877 TaxID=3049074 RepID=UPI0025A3C3A9|nr:DUF6318 family protein [Arthrobacter sp. zg-Y877]MDM7990618.1 DUF6318 family protein [Arthrobacter sp. zg-Y877]
MFRSTALRCTVRLRFVAAAVVVPMLFLTACTDASGDSGDSGDGGTPSSQASTPTPTPSPTPSAMYKPASAEGPAENVPLPVMPEEAKVQSKEGLEAFAKYWYDLVNYGYETGDVGPVQAISSPDCAACLNYYEAVEQGFIGDDWMAQGHIEVKDAYSEFVLTPQGRFQVLVMLQQGDMEFYGPSGLQGIDDGDTAPAVQLFEASYADGQWTLLFIDTMKTNVP